MQNVIYKLEQPSEELSFAYYILFICSHAYAMRQRRVLNDDEWTGWLLWMRNCFKYGTLGEQWNPIPRSESWFHPDFQNFINKEVVPKPESKRYNQCQNNNDSLKLSNKSSHLLLVVI